MNSLPEWAQTVAVFDTETTGVDVETARIVTATVALLDAGGAVVERRDWIIDPLIEIPEAASAVHGISTEMARTSGMQPSIAILQIIETLADVFDRGFPVVAFNAPYDFTTLKHEAARHRLGALMQPQPVLDPLVIDRHLDKYRKGKRTLTATLDHYGVEIGQAHDAGEDAIASGRLLQKIASTFSSKLPTSAEEIHFAQIEWARAQGESFQEWMRKTKPDFVSDSSWPIR